MGPVRRYPRPMTSGGNAPSTRLVGLIWDVDGTLSDTLDLCADAIATAIVRHGGPQLSRREVTSMFGPTEEGILKVVLGDRDGEAAAETYLALYAEGHRSRRAFEGITELIRDLAATGLPMGVVTGKGARSAEITLRSLELDGVFDPIVAGSESGSIKTQAIRSIVERWNVDPAAVAYIGDALSDVTHAREAGVVPVSAAWKPEADVRRLAALRPAAVIREVDDLSAWLAPRLVRGLDG
jgi:phosphoglycolate phosphatase-like HAD superfamily hydrolase